MRKKEPHENPPTQDRLLALVWPAPPDTKPGAIIVNHIEPPFEDFYEIWGVRDDGMMECLFRNTREEFLLFADESDVPQIKKIAEMYRTVWKKEGLV